MSAPVTHSHKLVAIMNEKIESGVALNALAHISLGLGSLVGAKALQLIDYKDADEGSHANVSQIPFIILKANSNQIRKIRSLAREQKMSSVDFTDTMRCGTYLEQLEKSKQTHELDMTYLGIVLFGPWAEVSALTQKFSLWK